MHPRIGSTFDPHHVEGIANLRTRIQLDLQLQHVVRIHIHRNALVS